MHRGGDFAKDRLRTLHGYEVQGTLLPGQVVRWNQGHELVRTFWCERGEDPNEVLNHQVGAEVAFSLAVRSDQRADHHLRSVYSYEVLHAQLPREVVR